MSTLSGRLHPVNRQEGFFMAAIAKTVYFGAGFGRSIGRLDGDRPGRRRPSVRHPPIGGPLFRQRRRQRDRNRQRQGRIAEHQTPADAAAAPPALARGRRLKKIFHLLQKAGLLPPGETRNARATPRTPQEARRGIGEDVSSRTRPRGRASVALSAPRVGPRSSVAAVRVRPGAVPSGPATRVFEQPKVGRQGRRRRRATSRPASPSCGRRWKRRTPARWANTLPGSIPRRNNASASAGPPDNVSRRV